MELRWKQDGDELRASLGNGAIEVHTDGELYDVNYVYPDGEACIAIDITSLSTAKIVAQCFVDAVTTPTPVRVKLDDVANGSKVRTPRGIGVVETRDRVSGIVEVKIGSVYMPFGNHIEVEVISDAPAAPQPSAPAMKPLRTCNVGDEVWVLGTIYSPIDDDGDVSVLIDRGSLCDIDGDTLVIPKA